MKLEGLRGSSRLGTTRGSWQIAQISGEMEANAIAGRRFVLSAEDVEYDKGTRLFENLLTTQGTTSAPFVGAIMQAV